MTDTAFWQGAGILTFVAIMLIYVVWDWRIRQRKQQERTWHEYDAGWYRNLKRRYEIWLYSRKR